MGADWRPFRLGRDKCPLMKKFILLLVLVSTQAFALTKTGVVTHIHDGDTLTISFGEDTKPKPVRFLGVDTPEVNFNGFSQGEMAIAARDYLRSLIPIGATIEIDVKGEWLLERRRIVATVFYQGENINLKMVESGHAAPYLIAPMTDEQIEMFSAAGKIAYDNKQGMYALTDIMPYEFRMQVQHRDGTNYVGDIETKILYLPTETSLVPAYRRYFIRNPEVAEKLGYTLRD